MKRLAFVALAVLVLAACQDAKKPELTTPGVSLAYQGVPVSTFIVTNTNDAGAGSLRQAILDANVSNGFDAIDFNIPAMSDAGCNAGTGVCTIQPVLSLPFITDPVVIDGYTQPGASPNTNPPGAGSNAVLKIELNGSNAGDNTTALNIRGGGSTVRGLAINSFGGGGDGIQLLFEGGNTIQGNFIGTDVTGTVGLGNDIGVLISADSKENVIGTDGDGVDDWAERNVISGNRRAGVRIQRGALTHVTDNNVVAGNLIGTDVTGTVALPNMRGVAIINVNGPEGNRIGTDGDGMSDAAERNIISGNSFVGIEIQAAALTVVAGNYIGTDVTGTQDLGNAQAGVLLTNGADNNTIGGTTPAVRNLISGNGLDGVILGGGATGNRVAGNYIGTDVTGTQALGNTRLGVLIINGADNTIGGQPVGAGNTIAFNGGTGVSVISATGNAVLSNSIFSNTGLGIDLGADGVTANDAGDSDTGANNLQNFPVITSALAAPGQLVVRGIIDTPNPKTVNIEFFANAVPLPGGDPSGHGEGAEFLGTVTPNVRGEFTATLPPVAPGTLISATATDADGNTSEFAANIEATGPRR